MRKGERGRVREREGESEGERERERENSPGTTVRATSRHITSRVT